MGRPDREDIDRVDAEEEDELGGAGSAASGMAAANVSGGLSSNAGGLGAAVLGGMVANDLMDDATGPGPDADVADTPGTYAGGGATGAGVDRVLPKDREDDNDLLD